MSDDPLVDDKGTNIFKTKRQTNRDLISHHFNKKIRSLNQKVDEMERFVSLRSGETGYITIDKEQIITVKIHTEITLKKGMKIMISVTSRDDDPGGLSYYLKDFEEGDDSIKIVIENKNEAREIRVNYFINE
jgi:hypothetical protein